MSDLEAQIKKNPKDPRTRTTRNKVFPVALIRKCYCHHIDTVRCILFQHFKFGINKIDTNLYNVHSEFSSMLGFCKDNEEILQFFNDLRLFFNVPIIYVE